MTEAKTWREAMYDAARLYLLGLLEQHKTVTAAAETAGLTRGSFYRLLKRAGIEQPHEYGERKRTRDNAARQALAAFVSGRSLGTH